MDIKKTYRLSVNNKTREVTVRPDTKLILILRNYLGLNSPRFGCGEEDCGSCRVLVDGELQYSCTLSIDETENRDVLTVEGFKNPKDLKGLNALANKRSITMAQLQKNFIQLNAGQCGYCLSGILVTAAKLLELNSTPNREEIQSALNDHLCRCGAHNRIIKAIELTGKELTAREMQND